MTFFDERTRARDAARLHGLLREVRGAPKDARDFLVFDKRDDWKDLGVGDDQMAAVDLSDNAMLERQIAQADAVARVLGYVDENDTISGGSRNDVLYGGAGDDRLVTLTGSAQQKGLRGRQIPIQAPAGPSHYRTPMERLEDNFLDSNRNTLSGAGARYARRATLPPDQAVRARMALQDDMDRYDAVSKADPWYDAPGGVLDKATAGAATLGGQVLGNAIAPENYLGPLGGLKVAGSRVVQNAISKMGPETLARAGALGVVGGAFFGDKLNPIPLGVDWFNRN